MTVEQLTKTLFQKNRLRHQALWLVILALGMVVQNDRHGYAAASTAIIDASGQTIKIEKPFTRIISLYGAHTENLFFLGLNTEIIGVSRNDHFPDKAKTKPWFSYHDDPEKFLQAAPDLVIVRPMIERGYPDLINRLKSFGITVVSLQPSTIHEMFSYWHTLGCLTGRTETAFRMIQEFKSQIDLFQSVTLKIQDKKKVYFEAIHSRMKTFTPGSMPLFVLETAGGINIADDAKSSRGTNIGIYGKEKILSHALEIDVYLAQEGLMNQTSIDMIKNEPGFDSIKAVKNNQIFIIDEMVVARPCFRLLSGIRQMIKILYPELYNELPPERTYDQWQTLVNFSE